MEAEVAKGVAAFLKTSKNPLNYPFSPYHFFSISLSFSTFVSNLLFPDYMHLKNDHSAQPKIALVSLHNVGGVLCDPLLLVLIFT